MPIDLSQIVCRLVLDYGMSWDDVRQTSLVQVRMLNGYMGDKMRAASVGGRR